MTRRKISYKKTKFLEIKTTVNTPWVWTVLFTNRVLQTNLLKSAMKKPGGLCHNEEIMSMQRDLHISKTKDLQL